MRSRKEISEQGRACRRSRSAGLPCPKYISFSFLFLLLLSSLSFAQGIEIRVDTIKVTKTKTIRIATLWTVPKFILQVSGSFNSGGMELNGHNGGFSRDDFKTGRTFGARNGFGISVAGKLPLHKKGNFWLDAAASFNRFQSDFITENTQYGKVSYNVFSGGIGLDYNFTPSHRVKYFLGGNALFSGINGKAELVTADSTSKYDVDIKTSFRIGYSVIVGLEYSFDKNVGFNLGVKFTHANLLLKKSNPVTDSTQTDLNDDTPPSPTLYSGWKQFAYASAFAGVSFYIGVRAKRYKLP